MNHKDFPHIMIHLSGSFKCDVVINLLCQHLVTKAKYGKNLMTWYSKYILCLQVNDV